MLAQSTPAIGSTSQLVQRVWWGHLAWIVAAALLGFAISSICCSWLRLPRNMFLIPYVVLVGLFLYGYQQWCGISVAGLLQHNWLWGLVGAVLVGLFVVTNVLSQPVSPRTTGLTLAFDLVWSGIVYGGIDALLLSVMPVLATWQAFSALGWTDSWPGRIGAGLMAVLLSLFVTAAYHLGFPEYRVAGGIVGPAIGNGVMSLGYLLSSNPLTAMFSHIAMHIAGVLHGADSVIQLPPHY